MQLGTRWPYRGTDRPARLPEVVLLAIDAVENDDELAVGADTDWHWTLTYLEGRPVVELDDGTSIRYDPTEDAATITAPPATAEDDEDW